MSSLLERMIQRTRAPLAGIGPLVEPRYAQANRQSLMGPFVEVSETSDAASETARGTPEALPASHIAPADGIHKRHVAEIPDSADRMLGAASARALVADVVRHDSIQSRAGPLEMRRSIIGAVAPRQAPVETAAASRTSLALLTIAPVRADAGRFAKEQISATQRTQANLASTRPPADKAFSSQQQTAPRIEKEPAKEAANVTLSIGHIEVRAAQAAERPRRPAFRPRVSLDDFLSRQNGARS